MIDAAVITSQRPNNNTDSKIGRKKNNPHALSVSEERFSSCGHPGKDVFRLDSVSSNRHLCSGCKACVDLDGLVRDKVEKGSKIRLQVSKFMFTVFDRTYDLCDLLEMVKDGPKCPIEPSQTSLRACLPLHKSLATDIQANIKATGVTASQKPLFCIEGSAMIESHCPKDVGPGSAACNS
ncbi:hypothetical protein BGZ98_006847 [Dissophora globulifera]|nr:hypothetical protein BGZ98_006847 [Dissophora globulifera]